MKRYHQMRTIRLTAVVALGVAGGVLFGWLACSSSSQEGADQSKEGGSARASADLIAQVNEILQLRSSSVVTLDINATPGAAASVNLPIAGEQYTLDLHPQSVRAPSYQVKVQLADGSLVDAEPGPIRTLRGTVVGVEGSAVAASLEADGLHARIFLSDDEQYWVEPVASRVAQAGPNHYVVYHNDDIIAPEKTCGLDHLPDALGNRGVLGTVRQTTAGACGTGLCVAELAADADFEYFQDYGSNVDTVTSRINSVINTVNVQYERDVDITHLITTIIVRSAETDPYSSTDAVTLLNQFRNHWQSNQSGVQRDLAQLFTGKEINSSTIGVAWLDAVCSSFGYSMVQSDFNGNFGCATDLSAHELGHNWGADHCSCISHTMNPFITCANQFHPTLSIPDIVSFRDSRTCLEGGTVCQVNTDCDDSNICTTDTCDAGTCSNTPVICDEPDACTTASCDPSDGSCTYVAIHCDDGNECTTDGCNPASGCVNVPVEPCCGDGVCDGGEDCDSCAEDCISGGGASGCGNGVCEPGEDCLSCSADCRGKQNGKPSRRYCCGGEIGGGGENPVYCGDPRCNASGFQCGSAEVFCCGDGFCDGAEDPCNCGTDCPGAAPDETGQCNDGLDNDCDGAVDCNDSDCIGNPACPSCGGNRSECSSNSQCCSNNCKNGTCRGN